MTTPEQHDPPHLDPERWRALQAREPEAVRHFAAHLARPCATCEAFLADLPDADALDALADEALTAAAASDAAALEDALGWERVRRRAFPSRRRTGLTAAAGLALAVAASLVLVLVPRDEEGSRRELEPQLGSGRIKGALPLTLELSPVVQLPDGGVRMVAEGERLPESAVVLVRYHVSEPATATLVLQPEGAKEQVLGHFELAPGTHDLSDAGGQPVGVSLRGERGRVDLSLVARTPGAPEATRAHLHLQVLPGR